MFCSRQKMLCRNCFQNRIHPSVWTTVCFTLPKLWRRHILLAFQLDLGNELSPNNKLTYSSPPFLFPQKKHLKCEETFCFMLYQPFCLSSGSEELGSRHYAVFPSQSQCVPATPWKLWHLCSYRSGTRSGTRPRTQDPKL